MLEGAGMSDQIRGMAVALRHWFEVIDTDELIVEAGLRAPRASGLFTRKVKGRRFEVLSVNALPPQVVRLKPNSPVTTLHLLQDIYDDGELRADPWRWWFAWISVEMIARIGPDPDGSKVKAFILNDDSLQQLRVTGARWLASNPVRMDILEREFATLIDRVSARTKDEGLPDAGRFESILRHPVLTILEAMSGEAGRISAAVTARLAERTK